MFQTTIPGPETEENRAIVDITKIWSNSRFLVGSLKNSHFLSVETFLQWLYDRQPISIVEKLNQ